MRCPQNLILQALPRDDLERLFPYLELVQLKPKRLLHHASVRVEHLYFIEEGLLSVVAKADQRKSVAVWLIGPEGFQFRYAHHRRFWRYCPFASVRPQPRQFGSDDRAALSGNLIGKARDP